MKRLILPLSSVLIWFGCSGSQPGPGDEEDKLRTETAFCAEWAKAVCNEDVVEACNGTRSGCLATQQAACRVLVPPGYRSERAEACLEAVEDAYDDAELTAEELAVVLKLGGDCTRLNDGGQDEGDDCVASIDCDGVNGFACVIKPGDSVGTCELPVTAGVGESCEEPEVVCDFENYCVDSAVGPVCLPRGELNESCTTDVACEAHLRCDIAVDAAEGTCGARAANGDMCQADRDCVSDICLAVTDTENICVDSIILTVRDPLCRELR